MADYADTKRQSPLLIKQQTWVGGVQDFVPKNRIGPTAAARLENIETHIHGTVRRRGGLRAWYQHISSSTDLPLLQKSFHGIRATVPLLASIYNSAYLTPKVTIDYGGSNQQSVTVTAPFAFDERTDVFQLLDRLYFTYRGFAPQYWEPGAMQLLQERASPGFPDTTIPPVATGVYFQGRAWAGADPDKPDLVYFSSGLGTDGNGESNSSPFTWDRVFQAFRMETGNVEAIIPFRNDALIVFTDRGIETIEPNPNNILNSYRITLNRIIGCINRHTIQMCGEEIFFMDQDGHIRSLSQTELDENRGITNAPISLSINNVIERQTKNRLAWTRSGFLNGIYWIWMPTNGSQYATEGWGWSIRDQAWIGPYFFQRDATGGTLTPAIVGGIANHRFDMDQQRSYFLIKNNSGAIKSYIGLDSADLTDEGTTIPVIIETAAYAPKEEVRKTWQHLEHEFRFISAPHDATVDMLVEVRSDEGGFNTAAIKTITPDAAPNLPATLPFTLTPYSRQTIKTSLTSITPRSYSIQQRLTIRDAIDTWELIATLMSAFPDNMEYNV